MIIEEIKDEVHGSARRLLFSRKDYWDVFDIVADDHEHAALRGWLENADLPYRVVALSNMTKSYGIFDPEQKFKRHWLEAEN